VKADFLNLKFTVPDIVAAGLVGLPDTDVLTVGWIGNVGYRWDFGKIFLEPHAILAYANTSIDQLTTLNALGANINFNDADSLRGALGLRAGISAPYSATHRIEANLTGRLWHEFLGDQNAILLGGAGGGLADIAINDNFNGTFGEVKAGVDVISNGPGWSGFLNAGVKFNDDFVTVTAKGGLSYRWAWY
jgi:outer membrane autotransporter protein